MEKFIYNYHPETFEFLSVGVADESPLEAGVYLYPANSTMTEPPKSNKNEVAVFDASSGAWHLFNDWRAVSLFSCVDGKLLNTVEIGDTPDSLNATETPCPSHLYDWDGSKWALNGEKKKIAEAEQDALNRITFQAELDARMEAAVAVASPLDYANKRKKLPADKAARLAAFNNYIDQLAALEYSEVVEWPVQPE